MPRILTPKAKRLHVEAQQRYAAKLAKRGAPTAEVILRAIGRAATTMTAAQPKVAQIVNTEGGSERIAVITALAVVLQQAIGALVEGGYDLSQTRLRLQRLLHDAQVQHVATEAAHEVSEVSPEGSGGTYSPGA